MSQLTLQPDASASGSTTEQPTTSVPSPKAEDEGLSRREIKWIPLFVPLAALMMLLAAAAVLGTA